MTHEEMVTFVDNLHPDGCGYVDVHKDILIKLLTTTAQRVREETIEERDALFEETNIKQLVEQMELSLEEDGDMHDEFCLCNSEDPDECDCENMKWAKMRCKEWMGKVNEMWVANIKHHRKHCSSVGNKDLTQIKRKILSTLNK